ncbi:uncharacterized protein LOC103791176 isoform X3 [Callithrix jacchus]
MLQAAAFSSAPTGQNKTSQLSTSQDVPGILITKAVGALWIPSTEQHSPEDRGSSPESISNRTVLIEIYTGDSQAPPVAFQTARQHPLKSVNSRPSGSLLYGRVASLQSLAFSQDCTTAF